MHLRNLDKKTLIIDLDPQGMLLQELELKIMKGKFHLQLLSDRNNSQHYVKQTKIENLDIICANVELSGFETEVAEDKNRAFILKELMNDIREKINIIKYLLTARPL